MWRAWVCTQIHSDVVAAAQSAVARVNAASTDHRTKQVSDDAAAAHRVGALLVEQIAIERRRFGSD